MAENKAIINKIIADATEMANNFLSEAEVNAQSVVKEAEQTCVEYLANSRADIEKECALMLERKNTIATLDSRKIGLKAKQELIDECFDGAFDKIMSLPKDEYLALITSLVTKYACDGDEVVLSATDKKVTATFIKTLSTTLGIKLTVSKEKADYEGGIILRSSVLDKNLTLKAILREQREEIEQETADILFNK